ncbi:MAG TPA: hypothetical protein VNM90_23830 [Haliangium sp.]|nr:hypothetical protein [Haliangium sp.]
MNTIKLELNIEEINMILEALGQLPFARVYTLIGRIQEQAHAQLQPSSPKEQDEKK